MMAKDQNDDKTKEEEEARGSLPIAPSKSSWRRNKVAREVRNGYKYYPLIATIETLTLLFCYIY